MFLTDDLIQFGRPKLVRKWGVFGRRCGNLCGIAKKVAHVERPFRRASCHKHTRFGQVPERDRPLGKGLTRGGRTRSTLADEADIGVGNRLVNRIPTEIERSLLTSIAMPHAQIGVGAIEL